VLIFCLTQCACLQRLKKKPVFTAKARVLNEKEQAELFTSHFIEAHNVVLPVRCAFTYKDMEGVSYLLLTESIDSIHQGKDTFHHQLNAIRYLNTKKEGMVKKWENSNFQIENIYHDGTEYSISFWTKYFSLVDVNKDGFIEPIIVYGTSGENGTDNGRVIIMVVYKGNKIAIRHQNSILDFQRNMKIDEAFYTLPLSVQNVMKMAMRKMEQDRITIFPMHWENEMQLKKLEIKND
jgi:hypothetical protein